METPCRQDVSDPCTFKVHVEQQCANLDLLLIHAAEDLVGPLHGDVDRPQLCSKALPYLLWVLHCHTQQYCCQLSDSACDVKSTLFVLEFV